MHRTQTDRCCHVRHGQRLVACASGRSTRASTWPPTRLRECLLLSPRGAADKSGSQNRMRGLRFGVCRVSGLGSTGCLGMSRVLSLEYTWYVDREVARRPGNFFGRLRPSPQMRVPAAGRQIAVAGSDGQPVLLRLSLSLKRWASLSDDETQSPMLWPMRCVSKNFVLPQSGHRQSYELVR